MPDQLFFDIVKMVAALAAIIGLVFAVVWLMKRFLPGAARAAGERVDMYMVGQLSLGSRQRVAVVRVHDRVLVLGITEESINTLADLTPPREPRQGGESSKEADDPKIFADLLAWPKDAVRPLPGQSAPRAASQPVSQFGQPAQQPVPGQPASQPLSQSVSQPLSQLGQVISKAVGQLGQPPAGQPDLALKPPASIDRDAIRDLFDSLSAPPKKN